MVLMLSLCFSQLMAQTYDECNFTGPSNPATEPASAINPDFPAVQVICADGAFPECSSPTAAGADFAADCGSPNYDFIITNPQNTATGDGGAAIVGVSPDGLFDPTGAVPPDFAVGDMACVTGFCYDLQQIQDLVDEINNNDSACSAAESIAGVAVCPIPVPNSLGDLFTLAAAIGGGGVVSVGDVVAILPQIDQLAALGINNVPVCGLLSGGDTAAGANQADYCMMVVDCAAGSPCEMIVAGPCDGVDIAAAPAAPVVTSESTCEADNTTLSGGMIDYTGVMCAAGATLEYSTDGVTFTTTAPMYDQMNAITVTVRCTCDADMTMTSPTEMVTTVPGSCPPPGDCTVVAGEPATPATDVCPAGQGPGPNGEMELTPTMDDLMTLSGTPAPTGTNGNGEPPTTNYVITNAAGEVQDVVGNIESMTYDFSPYYGAVGSSFCVYQAAYTQETVDDIATALNDVVCTTLCAPGLGCVGDLIGGCPVLTPPTELAGVLDVLNSVFNLVGQPLTAADVDDFLSNQTITLPTGSIPGLGPIIGDFVFDLADFGLDICGDLSNMGACFNVVSCTEPCDPACANDLFIQIESIEIVDPGQVVGTLNPLDNPTGCAGIASLDGIDGFIELDITINGNAIAQISVDGGTAGVTNGPFGAAVAAGTTACGEMSVDASVIVSEDDTGAAGGADDLTTNPTETFTLGGGTFTACDGNIIITYSTTCSVDCAACSTCPAITAVDMPADGCDATTQTVCVTYNADPTDLVTTDINGVAGTIDPVAMTICYDIPLANITCVPAMLDFVHAAVCVEDGSNILTTAGDDTNGSIGMATIYPIYSVVVVQPECDGVDGSAEVQVNGVACSTPAPVIGTAGVTNICPAVPPGTPATLTYDFSADANIVAATAAGCAPTGAALMDDISLPCDEACNGMVMGCTDPCADNFDPLATMDDGSCTPYDMTCNQDCTMGSFGGTFDPVNCMCMDETAPLLGCTDNMATNFDPAANCDDGTCIIPGVCNFSVGVSAFTCNDGGTMEDPADDTADVTFVVMSNGASFTTDVAIGGVTAGMDGMLLTEIGIAAGTNILVTFTSDDDPTCMFVLDYTVPDCTVQIPTLSQWGLMSLALLIMIMGSLKLGFNTVAFKTVRKK